MQLHLPEVLLALLFDLIVGDPDGRCHPVRLMGLAIDKAKALSRRLFHKSPRGEVISGFIILLSLCSGTYLSVYLLSWAISALLGHTLLYYLSIGFLCSFSLALKGLVQSTDDVFRSLPDLDKAKEKLSLIVGRDTDSLDENGVLRATAETLAENLSDSLIAPLFYILIGGPALGYLYRAVNTMDAMLGYRDPEHRYIGFFPAKADDIMNLIPSRLTALLLILAGLLARTFNRRLHPLLAIKVVLRDAHRHPSPNAGYPESAVAGLLGIRLLGPMSYRGRLYHKPFLNPEGREITPQDIPTLRLLTGLTVGLFILLTIVLWSF